MVDTGLEDVLRWITIGQAAVSGSSALALAIYAMCYYAKGGAWRRFTFVATFAPSYMAMFYYIARDLSERMGMPLVWRTYSGLVIFTVADYAMFTLLGHLMVKRKRVYSEIRHYTILHDPQIEAKKDK